MLDSDDDLPAARVNRGSATNLLTNLTGQFLIALPGMDDRRFARSVIYMVSHGPDGAMGIMINKPSAATTFETMLQELDIKVAGDLEDVTVFNGGPCEAGHGFVLHGDSYDSESSLQVEPGVRLSRTLDILKAIANGGGPDRYRIALGYAGWQAGQLEDELQGNGWLVVPGSASLLFHSATEAIWDLALAQLGATPALLSTQSGRA